MRLRKRLKETEIIDFAHKKMYTINYYYRAISFYSCGMIYDIDNVQSNIYSSS